MALSHCENVQIDCDFHDSFEPDIPDFDNIATSKIHDHSNQIAETLDTQNFERAIAILNTLKENPEHAKAINTWAKRLTNSKNDNQAINVLATGGVSNKKILAVQSRIAKNSHKNRFPDLKIKNKGSKPHNIANAISLNVRNKLTQSKK